MSRMGTLQMSLYTIQTCINIGVMMYISWKIHGLYTYVHTSSYLAICMYEDK